MGSTVTERPAASATPTIHRAGVLRGLLLAWGASVIVALAIGASHWTSTRHTMAAEQERARGEVQRAARAIDAELTRLPAIVTGVAGDLTAGRASRDQLNARLAGVIDITPQLFGIGAAYQPFAYDGELRLYAPYHRRTAGAGGVELILLDELYDYTQRKDGWFQAALANGPSWSEPAVSDASPVPVVEYSAPFTLPGSGQPTGVVHGTMSLAEVDDTVRSLDLGEIGYSFLVSGNGFVISHPYAGDLAGGDGELNRNYSATRQLFEIAKAAAAGEVKDAPDPVTGEPSWVLAEKVPSTGWTVGVVFFKEQALDGRALRQERMRLTLAVLVSVCLLLAAVVVRHAGGRLPRLWAGVIAGCAVAGLGVGVLWQQGHGAPPPRQAGDTVFANGGGVRSFIEKTMRTSLRQTGALPFYVPTGLQIQTFELTTANNVVVTGYVWQRYASNVPESVTRGFTLPDASDVNIAEEYRRQDADGVLIGWRIRATIRQSFDYSKYPLDQQWFQLRIWPLDVQSPLVLVPDLAAYQIIHPLAKPGISPDITLPGWEVERTQFSSHRRARNSSFGLTQSAADSLNELRFNIVLNRLLLEPTFSSLLPLAVSSFMVFALLVVVKESTRGNVVQTLSAYSALFFVLVLSELEMRRRLQSSTVVYIEYLYFVMYGMIVTVALTTITNAYHGIFPRVEYREHLLPKLLYWPVLLVAALVITLAVFY